MFRTCHQCVRILAGLWRLDTGLWPLRLRRLRYQCSFLRPLFAARIFVCVAFRDREGKVQLAYLCSLASRIRGCPEAKPERTPTFHRISGAISFVPSYNPLKFANSTCDFSSCTNFATFPGSKFAFLCIRNLSNDVLSTFSAAVCYAKSS